MQDPIEDALLDAHQFEETVHNLEDFNQKLEETKSNINDNSIDLVANFMETVVVVSQVRHKAETLEEEISERT